MCINSKLNFRQHSQVFGIYATQLLGQELFVEVNNITYLLGLYNLQKLLLDVLKSSGSLTSSFLIPRALLTVFRQLLRQWLIHYAFILLSLFLWSISLNTSYFLFFRGTNLRYFGHNGRIDRGQFYLCLRVILALIEEIQPWCLRPDSVLGS